MKQRHVLHWAARYDVLVWLMTLGREQRFREKLLAPAALKTGEDVLDVGCGTGSLAIVAKRIVGANGSVMGIDPSEEMIARARRKGTKGGVAIRFDVGRAESMGMPDNTFDVVLSTVMMHHIPRAARPDAVREMRRVLKPGGRVLIVDFGDTRARRRSFAGHLHRHMNLTSDDLVKLAGDAGLDVVEKGSVGMWDLHFVVAIKR